MWIEKYRPRSLREIEGQSEVVKRLVSFSKRKQLPNLLLWGPEGVGKTSAVLALASELYGSHSWEDNLVLMECHNFSEQRKRWLRDDMRFRAYYDEHKSAMDIFKGMIREYAALAPINAPFRLMVFCNADALPVDAQQALRRIMERSSRTSRFVFITTKPAPVIPGLRSRCLNLHFQPLDKSGAMDSVLKRIARHECLELTEQGLETLKRYAHTDLGLAITIMEAASASISASASASPSGPTSTPIRIGSKEIEEVMREVRRVSISAEAADLIDKALSGRYDALRTTLKGLMWDEKRSGSELMAAIHEVMIDRGVRAEGSRLGMKRLARAMMYAGDADYRLCRSFNGMVHIEELMVRYQHLYRW